MGARTTLLGIGLAGSLLATGCSVETGNAMSAGDGQCVAMSGTVALGRDQLIYVGGDLSYDVGSIGDYLRIKNIGNNVLNLKQTGGDGGVLIVNGVNVGVDRGGNDTATNMTVTDSPDPNANHISYHENKAQEDYHAMRQGGSVVLSFTTVCEAS